MFSFSVHVFFYRQCQIEQEFFTNLTRVLHEEKGILKKQQKNFSVWLQSFFIHWTVWTSKSSFVSLHFSSILAKANIFLSAKENWPFRLWISVPEALSMSSKSKDPNSGWWKTDWTGSKENRRKIPYFLPKLKEIVVGKSIRGKSFKIILFEFSRAKKYNLQPDFGAKLQIDHKFKYLDFSAKIK